MHLAGRWFTGFDFDQEILHQSTFSKTGTGGFKNPNYSSGCLNRSCVSVSK